MKLNTGCDHGTVWLSDVSGRLAIMGWFFLASVAFGALCGVVVLFHGARSLRSPRRAFTENAIAQH